MKQLLALLFLCTGCAQQPAPAPAPAPPPGPTPTVMVDAAPAPPPKPDAAFNVVQAIADMCANVTQIGCVEPRCAVVALHAIDKHLTIVPLDCLAGAKTKAEVRACGYFACP